MLMPAFYLAEVILLPFNLGNKYSWTTVVLTLIKCKPFIFVPPKMSWDCKIIWELKEYILTCNIFLLNSWVWKTFLKYNSEFRCKLCKATFWLKQAKLKSHTRLPNSTSWCFWILHLNVMVWGNVLFSFHGTILSKSDNCKS